MHVISKTFEKFEHSIEEKFIQQCSERDSRSYDPLYFSFPKDFHVAVMQLTFYQNRLLLLNIKKGTHDK